MTVQNVTGYGSFVHCKSPMSDVSIFQKTHLYVLPDILRALVFSII